MSKLEPMQADQYAEGQLVTRGLWVGDTPEMDYEEYKERMICLRSATSRIPFEKRKRMIAELERDYPKFHSKFIDNLYGRANKK